METTINYLGTVKSVKIGKSATKGLVYNKFKAQRPFRKEVHQTAKKAVEMGDTQ